MNIQRGIQWHSANLFEQTWLEITERNSSLYPWVGGFGLGEELQLYYFTNFKNSKITRGSEKSQYLKKPRIIIFYVFCFNITFAILSCCENQKEKEAEVIPKSQGSVTEILEHKTCWYACSGTVSWQCNSCSPHTGYPPTERQVRSGSKA